MIVSNAGEELLRVIDEHFPAIHEALKARVAAAGGLPFPSAQRALAELSSAYQAWKTTMQ